MSAEQVRILSDQVDQATARMAELMLENMLLKERVEKQEKTIEELRAVTTRSVDGTPTKSSAEPPEAPRKKKRAVE